MMTSIRIPDELYDKAVEIANEQHVSVDSVITSGFAQHIATLERIQRRAARGDRNNFLAVLDQTPESEPAETDQL